MLAEYIRIVTECDPVWWVLENVPGVPDVEIAGYVVQRFNLFASEFGVRQRRNRAIQFGYRDGLKLVLSRGESQQNLRPAAMASDLARGRGRTFADLCELQGLPRNFDLPGLSRAAKGRAVGNGVPVPVSKALAEAIRDRQVTQDIHVCLCNCGRPVTGKQIAATAACRKRLERARRGHRAASLRLNDSHFDSAADGHESAIQPGTLTLQNTPTIEPAPVAESRV